MGQVEESICFDLILLPHCAQARLLCHRCSPTTQVLHVREGAGVKDAAIDLPAQRSARWTAFFAVLFALELLNYISGMWNLISPVSLFKDG